MSTLDTTSTSASGAAGSRPTEVKGLKLLMSPEEGGTKKAVSYTHLTLPTKA